MSQDGPLFAFYMDGASINRELDNKYIRSARLIRKRSASVVLFCAGAIQRSPEMSCGMSERDDGFMREGQNAR